MKKGRFTEEQIIDALKRVENGLPPKDLCRDIGISDATFYNWRSKYGPHSSLGGLSPKEFANGLEVKLATQAA